MSGELKTFLQRWLVTTLGVLVAVVIVPGIDYESVPDVLLASLLLGALNAFVRPLMLWLTLPLVIFSLGLFVLVVNALLLYLVGHMLPGFSVAGFWSAFFGGLIISIVSMGINALAGFRRTRFVFKWHRRRNDSRNDNNSGDFIDV